MEVEEVLVDLPERHQTEVQQFDIEKSIKSWNGRSVRSVAITGLFLLACFYTLYLAQEFFIPLVLAIIFNFFLSPFVRSLKKILIPEAAGAAIVMLFGIGVVSLLIYELSAPVAQWLERTPEIVAKLSNSIRTLKGPVDKVSQATEQIGKIASATVDQSKKPAEVELKRPALINSLFTKTRDALFGLTVLVVLLYFLLSCGDLFLRKLISVLPKFEDKKRAVKILREIEDSISKYLITVAMINACLGTTAGLVFWALGMPNPALWGALAFLLHFIPYLGALTEIGIVSLVAFVVFPPGHAILIPAAYLCLAIAEANFVTPYVMGRRMTLNPVVIFVCITFWGFLWGILGIFLAVPALVMFKIFCDHVEPLAPIGEFLGG
jgi:predicted PurR-regulated permease PerM